MEQEKSFLGSGIHFPIGVDRLYGRIEGSDHEQHIAESVRIILFTSKGERVMRPEFGCSIRDYMFETPNYTTLSRIEEEARNALIRWEPRITDVETKASIADDGRLNLEISYRVRSTNNPYNLVFPFYMTEGYGTGADEG